MNPESAAPGIMDRLRTETRPQHDKAEESGFGVAVMSQTLSRGAYCVHIAAHHAILSAIETAHTTSASPRIQSLWHDGLKKVPLLENDLTALGCDETIMPAQTREAVDRFCSMVERRRLDAPESLPGVLYVLEGSTMGGSIMKMKLAESLGLSAGNGLDYYSVYGNDVRKHFMDFRERMGTAFDGSGFEDSIVEAGCETFELIGDVFRSIPLETEQPA